MKSDRISLSVCTFLFDEIDHKHCRLNLKGIQIERSYPKYSYQILYLQVAVATHGLK